MIPVEGHKNLFREESGAIVNTDTQGYSQYIKMKNIRNNEKQQLDDMRKEIDELKSLLKEVLGR
tara:strand:- start:1812 stop:2003 length:192 start_codon:yes stop_codon:yes gene_type:complete